MNGYYRDPFLYAMTVAADADASTTGTIENRPDGPWFTGPAKTPRWMRLRSSGLQIRCVDEGFLVTPPPELEWQDSFRGTVDDLGLVEIDGASLLRIPQMDDGVVRVDESDRVVAGAVLLRAFVDQGL